MPILNPDLSKIPLWRRRPTRSEHPITAYRVWGLRRYQFLGQKSQWILTSAAKREIFWEGPYLRADERPVDPAVWDKDRSKTGHVFQYAGIHAVKVEKQAFELTSAYSAPVLGEVKLWGRVAQFELGYRAEYCMIQKLWLRPSLATSDDRIVTKMLKDLADRYQCDVEIYGSSRKEKRRG